jgi:hypothetical protein
MVYWSGATHLMDSLLTQSVIYIYIYIYIYTNDLLTNTFLVGWEGGIK